ncbi:MAG: class I SAM-dependent methyltransferase [Flavobacteriales bacterium]|nr:class I SAM-dependent methyltransferase [Flavobacteriales bacterium]MBL0035717.1 class I SAM-dependent methyltransferase [Flavobacteriales bacterium]
MKPNVALLLVACIVAFASCTPGEGPQPVDDGQQANRPAVPTADWRMADSVIKFMGDVEGRTVADLFAGDGYYTFELLDAGARVIAIESDPALISAIQAKAAEKGIGPDRLQTRLVATGDPGITPGEVDHALCTTVYVNITDRQHFFTQVHAGLKPAGQLVVVDFLQEQTPMGPPMELRVDINQVMDELQPCGFSDIISNTKKIPHRFVIQALELGMPE